MNIHVYLNDVEICDFFSNAYTCISNTNVNILNACSLSNM